MPDDWCIENDFATQKELAERARARPYFLARATVDIKAGDLVVLTTEPDGTLRARPATPADLLEIIGGKPAESENAR